MGQVETIRGKLIQYISVNGAGCDNRRQVDTIRIRKWGRLIQYISNNNEVIKKSNVLTMCSVRPKYYLISFTLVGIDAPDWST